MYYISHHTVAVLETTVYVNLLSFFLLHLVVTGFNYFIYIYICIYIYIYIECIIYHITQ